MLPRALAAANAAVDHLEDGDRVSVISFDTRPTTDVSMTTVNPSTRQAIRSAIQNISLGGDTCISCGIHAGVEELHLLAGELWIDERKLRPGDYNSSAPAAQDKLVFSETGCTCVLVTSTRDLMP